MGLGVTRRRSNRELRGLPEIKTILAAGGLARRECVLGLAWALLGSEWGGHSAWSNPSLLGLVARKAAPLTATDLDGLIAEAEQQRLGSREIIVRAAETDRGRRSTTTMT